MLEEIVKTVHPNRISFIGGALTTAGVPLLLNPLTDIYGAALIGAGQGIDCIDGSLARKYGERTKEGARLDPLLDKIKFLAIGGYVFSKELYTNNVLLPLTIAANFAVDYISQRARGPIKEQLEDSVKAVAYPKRCEKDLDEVSSDRANVYGKIKAGLQNVATLGYIAEKIYTNHFGNISENPEKVLTYSFASMLALSASIGIVGVLKRIKNKREKT